MRTIVDYNMYLFVLIYYYYVCMQLLQLFWVLLFTAGSVDLVLLQNPPT